MKLRLIEFRNRLEEEQLCLWSVCDTIKVLIERLWIIERALIQSICRNCSWSDDDVNTTYILYRQKVDPPFTHPPHEHISLGLRLCGVGLGCEIMLSWFHIFLEVSMACTNIVFEHLRLVTLLEDLAMLPHTCARLFNCSVDMLANRTFITQRPRH